MGMYRYTHESTCEHVNNSAGIQLSAYDTLKNAAGKRHPDGECTKLDFFVSGAVSGLIAQTVAFPIELIRRRLQVQSFIPDSSTLSSSASTSASSANVQTPRPSGFFPMFRHIIKSDGPLGLYKGLTPNYLKIIPAAGTSFLVFEETKRLLRMC